MNASFRFGPYGFTLVGDVPPSPSLAAFRGEHALSDTIVTIEWRETSRSAALPELRDEEIAGPRFAASFRKPADGPQLAAHVEGTTDRERELAMASLLGSLVIHAAARDGHFVLHCCGIRVGGGVALLAGPSGAGKSTLARSAGSRAFTYNAAIVDCTARVAWPLPFTRHNDPAIHRTDAERVILWGTLEKASEFGYECRTATEATHVLVHHVATIRGDPLAVDSIAAAIQFARGVPSARVKAALDEDAATAIDRKIEEGRLRPC